MTLNDIQAIRIFAKQTAHNNWLPEEFRKAMSESLLNIANKLKENPETVKIVILTDVMLFEEDIEDTVAVSSAIECQSQSEWMDEQIQIVKFN
jgi:hypothetical protein